MAIIPNRAPSAFHAGDTVKWLESARNYLPADGWALVADLTNGSNHYTITSSDNGDGRHLFTLSAATSATFAVGEYRLGIAATNAANERFTIAQSTVSVRPNLSSAADARSHVKKTLDAIESWIESRNPGVAEYSVAGRSMKYWSVDELLKMQSRYRQLYKQEQDADRLVSGRRPRRRLLTRMQA
jgi:hypothetical protein